MSGLLTNSPLPPMHRIDAGRAAATLDYADMCNLSELFREWAVNDERLDADQRTKLILQSADYELLAEHCGRSWVATAPETPPDALAFVAQRMRGTDG